MAQKKPAGAKLQRLHRALCECVMVVVGSLRDVGDVGCRPIGSGPWRDDG